MFDKIFFVNSLFGMSDSGMELIWGLNIMYNVVEVNVIIWDYNFCDVQSVFQLVIVDMIWGNGEGFIYGEVYYYKFCYWECGDKIDLQMEIVNFYVCFDYECFLVYQMFIIEYCSLVGFGSGVDCY